MMRPIIYLVAILASHALAIELVKGQLNGLDRRQTTDYCGVDRKPNSFLLWIDLIYFPWWHGLVHIILQSLPNRAAVSLPHSYSPYHTKIV